MKYEIHKLDKRYRYDAWFKYYIGFGSRMSVNRGPENFNRIQKWFIDTYGWSAEVRQYEEMYDWHLPIRPVMMSVKGGWVRPAPKTLPEYCNPSWSWTNGYDDLRIYIASDKELSFFQLAHPLNV
jgi:hypothetical protein